MTVPTISSLTPALVHTGGRCLVHVVGTGFRVPPLPAPGLGGLAPAVCRAVSVTFGGVASARVLVLSTTRLLATVPVSPIPATKEYDYGEGSVDVVVQNLDDHDVPIPGEHVTLANGLTYQRAQLATETDFTRLIGTLIDTLRREVIPNVCLSSHTDYDSNPEDGLNVTDLADLPGVAIMGPALVPNRDQSPNEYQSAEDPAFPGEYLVRRPSRGVDLRFTLVGVSDNPPELLNLSALVQQFFERNCWLEMARSADDPSLGTVRYEMDFAPEGLPSDTSVSNVSNIRSFSGTFVIRGFGLEGVAGFPTDSAVTKTADTDDEGLRLRSEPLADL